MSTNVYIGARYVPIFDGDWDSAKVYEPLTIVNYNGGSYTSKRAVPANTLPTNTDYWVLTGNYNGQIAALQNAVGNVQDLHTSATNLTDAINEVNDVATANKVVVITDSFGVTPSSADNFLVALKSQLGLSNDDFIASAEGGCGFVNPSTAGHTFLTNLNTVLSSMTADDKKAVKTFIVVGGVNDTRLDMNIDTFRPAVKTLFTTAKAAFPNAKMYGAYNATLFHQDFTAARRALKMSFSTQMAVKATEAGAAFLPLNVVMSIYGATASDGIHPSSAGSVIIADALINIINGGGTIEYMNSWNKTPIDFMGGCLNSKFVLKNSSVLYNNSSAPLNLTWLFTQLGTETGLPYPVANDTVIFRPFCLKMTHSDDTVDYKFDALIKFRNDGIYEISIPSGSNSVVKIEVFAAGAYAQVNTVADI